MKQSQVLKPGQFTIVSELPKCDFSDGVAVICKPAKFDSVCNINMRSWANMCAAHYREYGIGKLGIGYGQKLLTDNQLEELYINEILPFDKRSLKEIWNDALTE